MSNFGIKEVDFGFVILCPERDLGGLISTVRSAKSHFPQASLLCMLPPDTTKKEMVEFAEVCPVVKGKGTYTSLINTGIKKSEKPWNFIIISGSVFKPRFYHKYGYFLEDEKDILYPIVDFQCDFADATLNGILIHKIAIKEVGEFEDGELSWSKLTWSLKAAEKGYKFKALAGARVF
jgi:hypothetical protein